MRNVNQKGKFLCAAALATVSCGLGQAAAAAAPSSGINTGSLPQAANTALATPNLPIFSPGFIVTPSDAGYEVPNSWYRTGDPLNSSSAGTPGWVSSPDTLVGSAVAYASAYNSAAVNAPTVSSLTSTGATDNAALGNLMSGSSSGGPGAATLSSDSSSPSVTVTVGGTLELSQSGQGSYAYAGFTPNLNISANVPLTANVTFTPNSSNITATNDAWGAPVNWGWGGLGLSIIDAGIVTTAVAGDIKGDFSVNDNINAFSVMLNDGPTQDIESIPLGTVALDGADASEVQGFPSAGINVSANFTINFNVTIPDLASAVMDQATVNLLNLTIDQGGYLYANAGISGSNFVVQQNLSNSGTLNDLGGTVEGQVVNDGSLTLGAGLTVQGLLGNYSPGVIYVPTGTSLNASGGLNNWADVSVNGGTLNIATGTQSNAGLLHVSDSGSINFGSGSTLDNTGEVEADGGTVNLNNINVINTGKVVSIGGGVINLDNSTISGGTLGDGSTGTFDVSGNSTLGSLTSNAAINLFGGNTGAKLDNGAEVLNITGDLVDNGTIMVNSNDATYSNGIWNGAALDFGDTTGAQTVSGTGTITLNAGGVYAQLDGSLTQAAGHSITGYGQIQATLVNNGTVNADVNGQTLEVLPPSGVTPATLAITNNGLMEATNGGTLQFDNGVSLLNTGKIEIEDGTISSPTALNVGDGTLIGGGTINAPVVFSNDPSKLEYVVGGTPTANGLAVNGDVTLGGDLVVSFANGFQNIVTNLDTFTILSVGSQYTLSGSFLNVTDGGRLETADGFGSFQVNYGDSAAPNSVVLSNFVDGGGSVPEPATLALLLAGAGCLALLRRRRGRFCLDGIRRSF